jgi:threonine synthase
MKQISKSVGGTSKGLWAAMPLWAKGLIVVGGAFAVYKISKNLIGESRLDKTTRDNKQEEDGWNQELINESNKNKPTLSPAQMKSIANSIEAALDGYGTRDAQLISLFKQIKNNADFAGVNAAFGIRTIEAGRGIGWLAGHEKGTLVKVIQEADNSTLETINKDLQKKGIKYRL